MPVQVDMTVEEAQEYANGLWKAYYQENGPTMLAKKCSACISAWRENGSAQTKKPPSFPPNYKDRCPMCGEELENGVSL